MGAASLRKVSVTHWHLAGIGRQIQVRLVRGHVLRRHSLVRLDILSLHLLCIGNSLLGCEWLLSLSVGLLLLLLLLLHLVNLILIHLLDRSLLIKFACKMDGC